MVLALKILSQLEEMELFMKVPHWQKYGVYFRSGFPSITKLTY